MAKPKGRAVEDSLPSPKAMAGLYSPGQQSGTWNAHVEQMNPTAARKGIELARKWSGENFFMSGLLWARVGFCNYGLRIKVQHPRGSVKPETEWKKKNLPNILSFLESAWMEWLSLDNLVLFWRAKPHGMQCPIHVLRPEHVVYTNTLGMEVLRIPLKLTPQERSLLDPILAQRYSGADLVLGDAKHREFNEAYPDLAEHFMVMRRAASGTELSLPRMRALFPALAQSESMEVGEQAYAFAGRRVVMLHRLGHEIKNGPKAGSPAWFWKAERSTQVEKLFKGKTGFIEATANFDHQMELFWLDTAKFGAEKWRTITDRISMWSGALGLIYGAKGTNTDLLSMLRMECLNERARFAAAITPIVQQAFQCPGELSLTWKNDCFSNSRLAAEMLKWAHQSGVASTSTTRSEYLGPGEVEAESDNLKAEKKDEAGNTPLFSMAQGKKPDLSKPGGRPGADATS